MKTVRRYSFVFFIGLFLWTLGLVSIALAQAPAPRVSSPKAAPAASQRSDAYLSVEDVVQLVQAGLSEDLVIAKIVKNGKAFDLSTSELLQLKKARATDNIIRAMMNPNQTHRPKNEDSVQPQSPIPHTEQKLADAAQTGLANVPPPIKALVFDSGEFKRGVLLQLPPPANRQEVAQYKRQNAAYQSGNFPPPVPRGDVDVKQKLPRLLASLSLIKLDAVNEKFYGGTRYFAYDTPQMATHVTQVSQDYLTEGYRWIKIGERVLQAVNYTNKYKINPLGTGERQAFALTFSYRLRETIPGFPQVNKLFDGKAIAVMDPSDGQWKLKGAGGEEVALSDRGKQEYLELIESPNFEIPQGTTTGQAPVSAAGMSPQSTPADQQREQEESRRAAAESVLRKYPDARAYRVRHDHGSGALTTVEERWRFCEGILYVFQDRLKFEVTGTKDGAKHEFEAAFADIKEVKANRMPLIRYEAFHIRLNSGQNYNFAFPGLDPAQVLAAFPAILR